MQKEFLSKNTEIEDFYVSVPVGNALMESSLSIKSKTVETTKKEIGL